MKLFPVTLLILSLISAASVSAQEPWSDLLDVDLVYRTSATPNNGWNLRFGAGIEREPTFQGSDDAEIEADPFLLASYRLGDNSFFFAGGGLGYSRMFNQNFGLFLQLEAEDTREEEDDERLLGLGDQDEELELEIAGKYISGPLQLGGSVALATGDKGVVWFLGSSYSWRFNQDKLLVTLSADISGSNRDNQVTDFGITVAQSEASQFGYSEFAPEGGLKSFGTGVQLDYKISERWYVYAEVENELFLGDVKDSPLIIQDGSENNFEVGVGVYFRF